VNLSGHLVAILHAVEQAKHASNSLVAALMQTRPCVELGITASSGPSARLAIPHLNVSRVLEGDGTGDVRAHGLLCWN
jgi:hypothetical protein